MKYITAALAACLVACGAWLWFRESTYSTALRTIEKQAQELTVLAEAHAKQEAAHKRTIATLESLRLSQAKLIKRQTEGAIAKDKALIAAPDWAAEPVPAGVADWLRQH